MAIDETVFNDLVDDVAAIEATLGPTPSGIYSDVRVRLDILEARINNPNVPTPNVTNPFYSAWKPEDLPRIILISSGVHGVVCTPSVGYDGYDGYIAPNFTIGGTEYPICLANSSGTLKDFRFRMATAPGTGQNITFYVRINGVNTGISTTITNTSTTGSDLVNTISVVAGDLISIRVVNSVASAAAYVISSINLIPSNILIEVD